MTNPIMLCPVCKKLVVPWKEMRLETMDEHICNPNGEPSYKMAYRCSDEKCITNTFTIFWNDEGELYTDDFIPFRDMNAIPFINGNNAPFGTFQRKCNVEVYKKDENKLLVTLPLWFPNVLSGMEIWSKWYYKSNKNGDILRRRLSFEYITKKRVYHQWGIKMLQYSMKNILNDWKSLRNNPEDKFSRDRLEQAVQRSWWPDAEWWRKMSGYFAAFLLKHSGGEVKA